MDKSKSSQRPCVLGKLSHCGDTIPSSLTLLMLTATQIYKIRRAKAAGQGVDLSLSNTKLSSRGGFGPFAGSMLAGIVVPMIGTVLCFWARWPGATASWFWLWASASWDRLGLQRQRKPLPPGTVLGLQLPGTRWTR